MRLAPPLLALLILSACADPKPAPDVCSGPNACCYYWCNKGTCDCVDGKAPNECSGVNACCYYWCDKGRCSCTNYIKNPAPDMAQPAAAPVPDDQFEEDGQ